MENNSTKWIWTAHWVAEDKDTPALVLFRRQLYLADRPEQAKLKISADSRYKLFVNGQMVEMGPSRGDLKIWFFDEVDLLPWLVSGENVLAVQVLRYPTEHRKGNHGIFRTEFPGLYIEGTVRDAAGNEYALDADETWKCRKDTGFCIISESEGFAPLQIYEDVQADKVLAGWMFPDYDDISWVPAWPYPRMSHAVSPGNLQPRTIPFLYRKERRFQGIVTLRQSVANRGVWEALLCEDAPLSIPPHTREIVELTAGEEMTGYLRLELSGGMNAKIAILQSEAYVQEGSCCDLPLKGNRTDWQHGHLEGFTDCYRPAGYGTMERPERYEPFWFRTFRFLRLEIETSDAPLCLHRFGYVETGYPLKVRTKVTVSDPDLTPIWDISERTLRRCMHETYEDCPFYEQLQYAMDARSEILYTYAVSADDRLARKCMDDFRRSQRYDGLLNASYPCYGPNVISGFSIYYILMLYDHMMWFGDKRLLEDHMPAVEGILHFFHRHRTADGYVDQLGGQNGEEKWSFIDWTPEWDATTGVPAAILEGPLTVESLLYVMGLQHAAKIADYIDRPEMAKCWRSKANEVQQAVQNFCTGKDGLLRDGPNVELYSQHAQVFAALTDTLDAAQTRRNLEITLLHPKEFIQCSVAMAFYLYRALQKTGLYAWTKEYWKLWTKMIEDGSTTCVEDGIGQRSDCHAWGALILYELPCAVLGVSPAQPGYETIRIAPEPGYLDHAQGEAMTPHGPVWVRWDVRKEPILEYKVPDGATVEVDTAALKQRAKEIKGETENETGIYHNHIS